MTNEEHAALIKVRDALASGKLDGHFDMNQAISVCGTFACIGGHMAQLMGMTEFNAINEYVLGNDELHVLFYPDDRAGVDWDDITPAQAVLAIDNFLSSGDPEWNEVIP